LHSSVGKVLEDMIDYRIIRSDRIHSFQIVPKLSDSDMCDWLAVIREVVHCQPIAARTEIRDVHQRSNLAERGRLLHARWNDDGLLSRHWQNDRIARDLNRSEIHVE